MATSAKTCPDCRNRLVPVNECICDDEAESWRTPLFQPPQFREAS